jgi:hypothetical protein
MSSVAAMRAKLCCVLATALGTMLICSVVVALPPST